MIENLRKYTGLIIVLFVLVIISFFLMDYGNMNRGSSGGMPYIKVAGRTYNDKEFNNLGASAYQLTQSLAQSGDMQLFSFLFGISGNAEFGSTKSMENFFAGRMLLRSAKEEFGIYPGEEEIDSFIRKLRAFTGPDGEFSQEQYRNFIEKGIGRLGLTEGDIRDLASDVIAQTKLAEILGAGLSTDRNAVAKNSALGGQRIAVEVTRIDLDPSKAKIDPSEEEIKPDGETTNDAFKTSEKRKFTYLIVKPNIPAEPAEIPAPAADATAEVKAEYEKSKATREAGIAEDRRKARLATDKLADDFVYELVDDKSADFEKLAEKNSWALKTTELFALADAPDELKAALRSSSTPGTAADELFRVIVTSDPLSKISPAIAIGEDEWLIARLEETEEVRVQTYEEASADARARLILEQAAAALKKATEEAAEKIKAALADGKTFTDATKEAGITTETVNLPEVTAGYQGDTNKVPSTLFDSAKYTDPGALTQPVIESDRAFIIHVAKREIVKKEDAATALEADFKRAQDALRISAFNSWLAAKTETAGIETLYNK
jgi:peptidyl-prolyl cis-trans isomerase D